MLSQSDSSSLHPGSTHFLVQDAVSTDVTVIASRCNSSAGREYFQAGLNPSVTFSHSSTSPFTIMPARKFSFKPNIHKRRLAGKGFITTGQSRILQQNDEQSLKFLRPLLLHPVAENKDIHVPSSVRLFKTIPMLTDQAQHDQGHLLMRLPAGEAWSKSPSNLKESPVFPMMKGRRMSESSLTLSDVYHDQERTTESSATDRAGLVTHWFSSASSQTPSLLGTSKCSRRGIL